MNSHKKSIVAIPTWMLLIVSFIEGGAVMIVELLGAKIIAPYYGVSLYVWSSVLGVTLGALALGYFMGGIISRKYKGSRSLFTVLLIGAFFTTMAPLIAPKILTVTEPLGVRMGSLISVLMYLLVPVTCFGSVSPIIIQLINKAPEEAGRSAGTVYAVSTVGGILATFATGFYLIPTIGIKLTAYGTGGLMALLALAYFVSSRRFAMLAVAAGMVLVNVALMPSKVKSDTIKVVYSSTGILGEWMVLDKGDVNNKGDGKVERILTLNGIDQTYTQVGFEPLSLWSYPHKLGAYAGIKPDGSKALLLGMGGGSIAFELLAMGMDLDVVELDERIGQITEDYFNYKPGSADLYFDDARHYVRNTTKKYDLVVIDLLIGEVQPTHFFTLEGFEDLKKVIEEDALVIINFQGNLFDPEFSLGPRSILKTMLASGFHVEHYSKKSKNNSLTKDIFYVASLKEHDYESLMSDLRYNAWFPYDDFSYEELISPEEIDLSGAYLLVDDKPRLDLLNSATILQWRKNKIVQNISKLMEEGVELYH